MDEHLFDGDALVIEDHQIQKVVLMDPQKKEYLAVEFDAPLVGIWSPPKKQAPFVCIEPWHSHTDFTEVIVPYDEREGTVKLGPHQKWTTDYAIRVK